ncbi:MAG: hypothetical protein SFW63_02445 [Alphaproteobacteria bacterium]|nr:hypothetical protein [Alphaproteobacteria bacterium]
MSQVLEKAGSALHTGTKELVQVGGDKATFTAFMAASNPAGTAAGTGAGAASAGAASVSGSALLGGVGVGAAVSAIVAQMEYVAKKRDIRNMLRQEIAVSQSKTLDAVTNDDVDSLSKKSGVIAIQMEKNKKERNVSIGTIFIATVATAALLTVMSGGFGILATSMFAPVAAYGEIAVFAAKVATSLLAFGAIKKPLTMIAEKAFGLDKKTTFERIASIAKDREDDRKITKERVMSVFVSANPEIDDYITATYGNSFDKLKVADKETIIQTLGEKLGITAITDDINAGRIRATELTFKVEGKASGVLPTAGEKPNHTVLMTIKERLHQVAEHLPGHHHHDQPQRSFVERVARVPAEQVGYVQRLNESRAAEAAVQR